MVPTDASIRPAPPGVSSFSSVLSFSSDVSIVCQAGVTRQCSEPCGISASPPERIQFFCHVECRRMNMSIIWDPHPRLHFSFLRKLRVGVVSRGTNDRVWIHEAWPQGSRARLRTRARLCRVGWHDWAAAVQTFSTTMWSDGTFVVVDKAPSKACSMSPPRVGADVKIGSCSTCTKVHVPGTEFCLTVRPRTRIR